MVSKQIQRCFQLGDISIDISNVTLNGNVLVEGSCQIAAVILTARSICLLQSTQSAVEVGTELTQYHACHINCSSEAHFVVAQLQNLLQNFLRQADILSQLLEGCIAVVVLQCSDQLLQSQLIEADLQLILIGAIGLVEGLDSIYQLCSDLGVALSQNHSHHDGILVILGEVHHNGAGIVAGDQDVVILADDFLYIGEIGSNGGGICQSPCNGCQLSVQIACDHQLQLAFTQGLAGAQGNIQDILRGIVTHGQIPCGGGEIVSSQNIMVLQSLLQLLEVGDICNQHINQFSQVGCADTTQNGIDGRIQAVLTADRAQNVLCAQIKDGLAIHSHSCSIIMCNSQLGSNIHCQSNQVRSGGDFSCGHRIDGDDHIVTLLGNGKVLVAYHTVCLLVTILQVCGNIGIKLTAQNSHVLAGNGTGDVSVSTVVTVHNKCSAAIGGDAAVNSLTVQVQNHALVQVQSNRSLSAADIVQQQNCIALFDLCQLLCSEHKHYFAQLFVLQRIDVDRQRNIFLIQILNICLNSQIQTGVVLGNQGGQLRCSQARRQLHCVYLSLQLVNNALNGQCLQVCIGYTLVICIVANLLVLQNALENAEDAFAQIHGNTQLTNGTVDGVIQSFVCDAVSQRIIQHIHQITHSHFSVQCIYVIHVSFTDHSQRSNVGSVYGVGQFADHLDHAVFQGNLCAQLLCLRNKCSCLLQHLSGTNCSYIEFHRCVVIKGQGSLQQCAALCAAGTTIQDLLGRNCQIADNVAVCINQLLNAGRVNVGAQHRIYQCAQIVLVIVQQSRIAQQDGLAAAAEQAQCKGHDALLHIGKIQRQDHDITLLGILHQGHAQGVSSVDQLGLCHINFRTGDGDLAVLQHSQNLGSAEGVLAGSCHIAADGVLVYIAGSGVTGQLDLATVNGDTTQILTIYVDGILLGGPGHHNGLRTGNQVIVTGHGADVMRFHFFGQTGLLGQSSNSSFQLCSVQITTGSHGPGIVRIARAFEGHANCNCRISRGGTGNGLYPSHGFGSLGVLLRVGIFQVVQQSAQGSLGVFPDDHQIMIDGVYIIELVSFFQCSLRLLEAFFVLIGQHTDQLGIVNHQGQQIVQLIDLLQILCLIDIEVNHTACLVSLQRGADGQIAVGADQRSQTSCCTGSGGQEAAVGLLRQSCHAHQQFRYGVVAQGGLNRVVIVDLLQIIQLFQQTVQRILLVLVIGGQGVRNVHHVQQRLVRNSQSGSGQCQLIVDISHLEAGAGAMYTVGQRDGVAVQTTAVGGPLQVAYTGAYRHCLDDHLTGLLVEVDLQILILGNDDADALTLNDGIAEQDVLQHGVHFGIGLNHQIGQILFLGHCTLLTGNRSSLGHQNHSALIQVVCVVDGVDILAGHITVGGQGQLIAVRHRSGQAVAVLEAFTVGNSDVLGCVSNGVDQILGQRKVVGQLSSGPVIVCGGNNAVPLRLCQSGGIGIDLSDGIHDLLLVSALAQGDHRCVVVSQVYRLGGVHQQGVDDRSLNHNTNIEHTHVVTHNRGCYVQVFLYSHVGGLQTVCPLGQLVIVNDLLGVHHGRCVPGVVLGSVVHRLHRLAQKLHNEDQQIQHFLLFNCLSLLVGQLLLERRQALLQLLQRSNGFVSLAQSSLCIFQLLDVRGSVVHKVQRLGLCLVENFICLRCLIRCDNTEHRCKGDRVAHTLNIGIIFDRNGSRLTHNGLAFQHLIDTVLQRLVGIVGFQECDGAVNVVGILDFLIVTQAAQQAVQLTKLCSTGFLGSYDGTCQLLLVTDGVAVLLRFLVDRFEHIKGFQIFQQVRQLIADMLQTGIVVGQIVNVVVVGDQCALQLLAIKHQHLQVAVHGMIVFQILCQVQVVLGLLLLEQSVSSGLRLRSAHIQLVHIIAAGQRDLVLVLLLRQSVDHIHNGLTLQSLCHHEHQHQLGCQSSVIAQSLVDHGLDVGICIGILCVVCREDACNLQELQQLDVSRQLPACFQQFLLLSFRDRDLQLVADFHRKLIIRSGIRAQIDITALGQRQFFVTGDHTVGVLQIEALRNPKVTLCILISGDSDLLDLLIDTDESAIGNFGRRQNIGITLICAQYAGTDDCVLLLG